MTPWSRKLHQVVGNVDLNSIQTRHRISINKVPEFSPNSYSRSFLQRRQLCRDTKAEELFFSSHILGRNNARMGCLFIYAAILGDLLNLLFLNYSLLCDVWVNYGSSSFLLIASLPCCLSMCPVLSLVFSHFLTLTRPETPLSLQRNWSCWILWF